MQVGGAGAKHFSEVRKMLRPDLARFIFASNLTQVPRGDKLTQVSQTNGASMARFDPPSALSRELLEQLYCTEHIPTEEIAKRLGCGASTILRTLHDYGVPVRAKRDYRMEFSRADLGRLYIEEGYSEDEIGELFDCSGRTIDRRLKELGISTRPACGVPIRTVPETV
jgi:DNA-binding CsgD family transcriptional regulator